jgi:hypothetical protein
MRQHHDPEHMAKLLARRERRGLTWSQLASESGVPATTLQWWGRRLRSARKQRRPKLASFVPVAVGESAPMLLPATLEVVLASGAWVRVPAGFDPEHLRRVVEALESGC